MSKNSEFAEKLQLVVEEYKKDKSNFKDYYKSMQDISKWLKEREK